VTGHTGFKGSWLCAWLDLLGAVTQGLSLPGVTTTPNLWDELRLETVREVRSDITSGQWHDAIMEFQPEIVFHLAAQPLVSVGYAEPKRTFTTNVLGTVCLLEMLTHLPSAKAAVMITTDKVYDTRQPTPFVETGFLGGSDPYSASKAAMELVVHSWPKPHCRLATARAGNVIGGGDWARDRLLPDLVRSWSEGMPLTLRRPRAVRPWQHVLEPIRGYILYAESLTRGAHSPSSLNFGPSQSQCVPVEDLVEYAANVWRSTDEAHHEVGWVKLPEPPMAETDLLVLGSDLARATLGWANALDWRQSVRRTIQWHIAHARGVEARHLVHEEIASYAAHLAENG
jgi:CDP-glucose 4,6-dehydratase